EEDRALLEQITEANADAGRRFLEYLVLIKRNTSSDLHTRLALACIDDLLQCLQDESTSKLWRAKASSYASPRPTPSSHLSSSTSTTTPSPNQTRTQLPSPPLPLPRAHHQPQQPFLSYFASTTPDAGSKRTRLKALFMLAGSGVYDPRVVQERLFSGLNINTSTTTSTSSEKKTTAGGGGNILALETAILYGKLEKHEAALEVLVRDLRDSTSAEAYCTLGGEVVPVKVALAVAESSFTSTSNSSATEVGLREWYFGLFEPPPYPHRQGRKVTAGTGVGVGAGGEAPAIVRQKSVREDVKRELLRDLAGVYMSDATYGMEWTTRLLEAQGMNLDVVDVVKHVPEQWPLASLDTFITRYFRRTLHTSYENVILKNLAAGQNLAVRERTWEILREQGCVFEEPDSDYEEDDHGGGGGVVDEKAAYAQAEELAEKMVVGGGEKTPSPLLPEDNVRVVAQEVRAKEPQGALGLVLGEPEREPEREVEVEVEGSEESKMEYGERDPEEEGSGEGSEGSERQERSEENGRQNESES
ncbi:hypothetical protein P691DRAFT_765651, partial [Macrolepiota fuliginosa MF-IS2]